MILAVRDGAPLSHAMEEHNAADTPEADFVRALLHRSPAARPTAEQALQLPLLNRTAPRKGCGHGLAHKSAKHTAVAAVGATGNVCDGKIQARAATRDANASTGAGGKNWARKGCASTGVAGSTRDDRDGSAWARVAA